jgi:3-ketosteroid 9alpha-monooxygenase subunit B
VIRQHSYRLRVVEVVRETDDACSIVLEPAEADAGRFAYRPGQFLTLNIPTDRAGGAARCYSLSSSPLLGERLKVTVKRTADGYGSNWICDHLGEGQEIESLRPSGTFTPHTLDADFLLFGGGSGITPLMSILKSALHAGRGHVTLVYANRDERSVIFRDELLALGKQYAGRLHVIHLLESVQGLPGVATLRELARPYAARHVFICGPTPFMDAVTEGVAGLGVPRGRTHHERFVSLDDDPFAEPDVALDDGAEAGVVEVQLDGESTTLAWPENGKLLDVLLAAGLDAPFSCREGRCSACACILLDGEVELLHNEVLDGQDIADGIILACQAVPRSDRVRVTYDQ